MVCVYPAWFSSRNTRSLSKRAIRTSADRIVRLCQQGGSCFLWCAGRMPCFAEGVDRDRLVPWLLADAEGGKDAIEDVVGGGGAGDSVDRAEGGVQIQKH